MANTAFEIPVPLALSIRNLEHKLVGGSNGPDFCFQAHELDVDQGEMVAITGPTGSGKTTLAHLSALLITPQTVDQFVLDGTDVRALLAAGRRREIEQLRRESIGVAMQFSDLLPSLTVEANVALALGLNGHEDIGERVTELLTALSLPVGGEPDLVRIRRMPAHLPSGGQKQRIGLARSVAMRPKLVVADEPTANLDGASADRIMHFLKRLCQEEGTAVLLVTHDRARAEKFADYIANVENGKLGPKVSTRPALPNSCGAAGAGDCVLGKSDEFRGTETGDLALPALFQGAGI